MPRLAPPVLPAGSLGSRPQPSLTAGDLLLRPAEPADAAALLAAYQDPDVSYWHAEHLTGDEAARYAEDWAGLWRTERRAGWLVVRDEALVGRITLAHLELASGSAEVTYWVLPEERGAGVASRSVEAVTAWAFAVGLHRLELTHSVANAASCRVAERTGYQLEGTMRQQFQHADGWHDMHLHARLRGQGRQPDR